MYYDYSPQFLIHNYPHMRSAEEDVLYTLMKLTYLYYWRQHMKLD